MKKFKLKLSIILVSLLLTSFTDEVQTRDCIVINFYEAEELERGSKVLDSYGNLEDAELLLIPSRIEEGNYQIILSRKGTNIYKLEGTGYYIETLYCYEYSIYDDAILQVQNNYGYRKGIINFN